MGCFWLSINTFAAGQYVSYAIEAIWPSYARLPNQIPASQGASTKDFLSFFLIWVIQFPFLLVHPSRLQPVFYTKAALVPVVALGTMIWALIKARDGPGIAYALTTPANRVAPGTARFIAFMYSVTSVQGTWATMGVNVADFSRYCRNPRSSWLQLFAFPVINTLVSIVAAITAACLLPVYGDVLYQPYLIVSKWGTSPGGRAAMFLASLAWALANVTTNVSANSISAANDLAALFPRWVNIRRGQLFVAVVGVWGFAPWKVLQSAANFLTFMSSYSVILAPIASLMFFDFFVIKHQRYNVFELYVPHGIYYYSKGWNWRAYVAVVCAVAPNMPGMVNAINPNIRIGDVKYVYMVSNIVAHFIALNVYYILNKLFPARESLIDHPVHEVLEDTPDVAVQYAESDSEKNDIKMNLV